MSHIDIHFQLIFNDMNTPLCHCTEIDGSMLQMSAYTGIGQALQLHYKLFMIFSTFVYFQMNC